MSKTKEWNATKILRLISSIWESVLGFPVLGGLIVIYGLYIPLLISLALGIAGTILASINDSKKSGFILQIIAGAAGWIPLVGFGLHLASAIVNWIQFAKE